MLKNIKILNKQFVIQSYKKDEYTYLVAIEEEFSSIRINFWAFNNNRKDEVFSSNQKTNKNWFDFVQNIDVSVIENQLRNIFN